MSTFITVTAEFNTADGEPTVHQVTFKPSGIVRDTTGNIIYTGEPIQVAVAAGVMTPIDLLATNSDGVDAFTYKVQVHYLGARDPSPWSVQIDKDEIGGTVDLADIAPASFVDESVTYVLRSEYQPLYDDVQQLLDDIGGTVLPDASAVPDGRVLMTKASEPLDCEWADPSLTLVNLTSAQTVTGRKTFSGGLWPTGAGVSSTAVGQDAAAAGSSTVAYGRNADASATSSSALGFGTIASGARSVSVGAAATSPGADSVAVGQLSVAQNTGNVAIGKAASASSTTCMAMGHLAAASQTNCMAIGASSEASAASATAVGYDSTASGSSSVAFGVIAVASASAATALGFGATASASQSTAVGNNAVAAGADSTAVGRGASVAAGVTGGTAIGQGATVSLGTFANPALAVGRNARALEGRAVAVGPSARADGISSTAIGRGAISAFTHAIAIGRGAWTNANNQVAIGYSGGSGRMDVFFNSGHTHKFDDPIDSITSTVTPSTAAIAIHGHDAFDATAAPTNDVAGGDLELCAGRGTGTAAGGSVLVQVAPAGGASNNTKNTLSTVIEAADVSGALGLGFFGATPVAKPTGVGVDAASIHAALVDLGLIAA